MNTRRTTHRESMHHNIAHPLRFGVEGPGDRVLGKGAGETPLQTHPHTHRHHSPTTQLNFFWAHTFFCSHLTESHGPCIGVAKYLSFIFHDDTFISQFWNILKTECKPNNIGPWSVCFHFSHSHGFLNVSLYFLGSSLMHDTMRFPLEIFLVCNIVFVKCGLGDELNEIKPNIHGKLFLLPPCWLFIHCF